MCVEIWLEHFQNFQSVKGANHFGSLWVIDIGESTNFVDSIF